MIEQEDRPRDLSSLVVQWVGSLVETGDPFEPYRLVDPCGLPVAAVAGYLRDLQAAGRPATTQRSYGMALLRWFRPVDGRDCLEPGDSCGGSRLLPVDPDR